MIRKRTTLDETSRCWSNFEEKEGAGNPHCTSIGKQGKEGSTGEAHQVTHLARVIETMQR
jgi:ApbE superfamily uncharacterized protein (UPF0280 family)